MAPRQYDYKYLTLEQAFKANASAFRGYSLVNLYAVVKEWTMPRATKGTDYHVVLKVVDATVANIQMPQPSEEEPFTDICINFFSAKHLLPKPRKVGDVIRIHRLKVQWFNGKPQFVAKVGTIMAGRGAGGYANCHYCLFDGPGDSVDNNPYFFSSQTFTFEPARDAPLINSMRQYWSEQGGAVFHSLLDSKFTIPLQQIKNAELFDLHCKVLDVIRRDGKAVLIVWDGSDARPFAPQTNTGLMGDSQSQQEDESVPQSNSELLDYGAHYWAPFPQEKVTTQEDLNTPGMKELSKVGTAFPVVMRQFDIDEEDLPEIGQWIRLRQLSSWTRGGQLQGLYMPNSKWAPAEPNDSWLQEVARRLQRRQVAMWAPQNQFGASQGSSQSQSQSQSGGVEGLPRPIVFGMTRTAHDNVPLHTLREVLMTEAPSRHRCLVRIVEHYPKDIHDFCSDGTEGLAIRGSPAAGSGRKRKGDSGDGAKDRGGTKASKTATGEGKAADDDAEEDQNGKSDEWTPVKKMEPSYEFRLSLLLEDATGRLRVNLCEPDSNDFFHGIAPCNLWDSEVTYSRVAAKMNALVTHSNERPEEGWVQCCIMSYVQPSEMEGQPPQRQYRLFGTSMVA